MTTIHEREQSLYQAALSKVGAACSGIIALEKSAAVILAGIAQHVYDGRRNRRGC